MLEEFVNYVDSFYGQNDPLYPMMSRETKQPLTKFDMGDGDSLDRERVRDILLEEYNYKFVGE